MPHTGPMVLVDEMVAWAPGEATCRLRIRQEAPFVQADGVDAVVCVEYMAQAVAACLGYEAFVGGEGVRVGMIIGCRKMEILQPRIPVGAEVEIRVKRVRGSQSLSHFSCEVATETPVATATMTLYHAEKPPED